MAEITSAQVKASLKQMADFVGAISRSADILTAVEAAEAKLKNFDKEIAAKEKALADLGAAENRWQAAEAKARKDFKDFQAELTKRREDMEHGLDGLRQQLREHQDALRHVMDERDKSVSDLNAQLKDKQGALAKVQAEIDRLKKAFAA